MKQFTVPDMTCGHCKKAIEEALIAVDNAAQITVDLNRHAISVASKAGADQIIASLDAAGYPATPL